ncbi:Ribosomal protein S18 acetylase RimI [Candidatus Pantoea symbiotica]|uniref:Ribosomal protein S18 acetylase RimI n=1 Tax=Candidatus Pantoea symbiotica TaxID=1884370 RepID=A0A1I3RQK6_9GAMM|nr:MULTISPECIES: GNAT family N-acetyltransferase [Pantoea]KAJ9433729.1 GNAT family N-acetyltransferase [Pantoea sp. YR343]MRT22604.1 GNAT family N-acetyltransferase [Enterobacteriaceae bacterium RIT697]SFJ48843.1 Ribosomal protein S18 acetylase RimI [Pantoea symbiotica]SFU40912.1 Ribosomal protein S18 acetylase RimI [Pantoea sp. YR525]
MIDIERLSATQAQPLLAALCDVLQGCVADGASVGFIDGDDRAAIERFWQDKIYSLASGDNQLLVAYQQGVIVATVMVGFSAMPNGRHRAEISKLLVHPRARRQGIARRLMQQAEQLAAEQGKNLLVLDTRSGDVATDLYLSMDWQIAGSIPMYAESTEGVLDATTVMFKLLR